MPPLHPLRVYADTSVYGGLFDDEFALHSIAFFRDVAAGAFTLVTSPVVALELDPAPEAVRSAYTRLTAQAEIVVPSAAAQTLQSQFLTQGVLGPRSAEDALHVALAFASGCPLLVSWNFKHIVHRVKALQYNAVAALLGYPPIDIRSPREVIAYDEQSEQDG
jgi:hypothetical protein